MLMELAYRLAVEDSPLINQIRDKIIVTITPAADPDGRDRYVEWYLRHLVETTNERDRITGPPYWGKYVFHDNNRDINYSQVEHAGAARLVPAVASADHARPARVGAVPLHLQRPGAAEPDARSDPLRRAADVRELRDDAVDEVRHARRVDARLRRHVVARLSRVHVVESQRPRAHVRDVRQRRRDDDEADDYRASWRRWRAAAARRGGGGQTTREWYRPLPPYREVDVVDAQQHELHADRRPDRARIRIGVPERDPRQLLSQEPQLDRSGQEGRAARVRHSRRDRRIRRASRC